MLVIVGAILGIKLGTGGGGTSTSGLGMSPAAPDVVHAVTHVPPSVAEKVGLGTSSAVARPEKVKGSPAKLTRDGKPELFFFGANYCPYCATERWPMIVALSRFGTFSGLKQTHSSSSDVYANTQTFSFYGSTYTSKYLSFDPVETTTNQPEGNYYKTLQTPTKEQLAIVDKFDKAPYVAGSGSSTSTGSIPFLSFGNRFIISGPSYTPQVLQGLSAGTIAGSLSDANAPTSQGIVATANWMSGAICSMTHNADRSVCSMPVVKKAEQELAKAHPPK